MDDFEAPSEIFTGAREAEHNTRFGPDAHDVGGGESFAVRQGG